MYVLVHLYGTEEGYSLQEMTPMLLLRKENLARQIIKVADVIVPGNKSYIFGQLLLKSLPSAQCKSMH